MKVIDKTQNIFNIITTYPEVKEVMANLGFTDILQPGILKSMGRFMTLEKGARLKGIQMHAIEETFLSKGFELK